KRFKFFTQQNTFTFLKASMDIGTILGILIGIGGVIIGNVAEGGSIGALFQLTAFLIVFGGTFGAVLVGNRWEDVKTGFSLLKICFTSDNDEERRVIATEVTQAARIVRKGSLLELEQ